MNSKKSATREKKIPTTPKTPAKLETASVNLSELARMRYTIRIIAGTISITDNMKNIILAVYMVNLFRLVNHNF